MKSYVSTSDELHSDITVSIVIPTLNEEISIGKFIDWCKEGIKKAHVKGEIIIIDSSTDKTPAIAKAKGAKVIRTPKRGLGQAYIDAIPYIRGKYVIMGDCDCTYDFRNIKPFIDKLERGYEFVMGSRFRGYIEPNSMPFLHRYLGTPVTSWILNLIYGSHYSDIHCGMRAITLDALKRMNLESSSWEYASEMVLKAAKLKLRTTEVPIRFYKEPEGRLSHFKRSGWTQSWYAGWINLKAMFLYAPDFFLMVPGIILFVIGILITLLLVNGPVHLGGIELSLHFMLLGVCLAIVGYSSIQMAILSKAYYCFDKKESEKYSKLITYNRGVFMGLALLGTGLILDIYLLAAYIKKGLMLETVSHSGVLGLLLIILGFQTFTFTLIFQMISSKKRYQEK